MKILNFGSLNIDFVYSVSHIVKDGETISASALELFSGGKGLNQSIALKRAGADVYHAGMVGKDGLMLLDVCDNNGIKREHVQISPSRTGNAIIQVDKNGENSIILYGGANKTITKGFVDSVLAGFSAGDLVVLQNEINLIGYIIDESYKKKLIIALNPSPFEGCLSYDLQKVTYFILNKTEGSQITGEDMPEMILNRMTELYPDSKIVLTLGKSGCVYKDKHNTYLQDAYNVTAVDTTAAGDTFLGYFLAQITGGLSIEVALKTASKASAIAVSRKGAADSIPHLDEVIKFSSSY